ncbi:MAG: cytochrome b5-like heme/steroid binding domain-containing protein [Nanoarchaeota archaeon]
MNKRYAIGGAIALIVLIVIFSIFLVRPNPSNSTAQDNSQIVQTNSQDTSQTPSSQPQNGITLQQLSQHNSQSDCWIGYNDKVYDVTSFLPNHPGGVNAIARHCGTAEAFQNAFKNQHGTSKVSMFMKVASYKGDLIV